MPQSIPCSNTVTVKSPFQTKTQNISLAVVSQVSFQFIMQDIRQFNWLLRPVGILKFFYVNEGKAMPIFYMQIALCLSFHRRRYDDEDGAQSLRSFVDQIQITQNIATYAMKSG
jgi:hypothetical protein